MSSNEANQPESETSADELVYDVDTFVSFSRITSAGARTKAPPIFSSNRRTKRDRAENMER